jgi:hypothetical protein
VSVQQARTGLTHRGDWILLGSAVILPSLIFAVLQAVPGLDLLFQSLLFHIIVVSMVSGCALIVAVLAGWAAARARQPAIVLLAVGCLYVGFLMLTHGLTTPIVGGRPFSMWVARTPTLSILSFALFTAAAMARPHHRLSRFVGRHPTGTLLAAGAVGFVACGAMVLWPAAGVGAAPFPHETGITQLVAAFTGVVSSSPPSRTTGGGSSPATGSSSPSFWPRSWEQRRCCRCSSARCGGSPGGTTTRSY